MISMKQYCLKSNLMKLFDYANNHFCNFSKATHTKKRKLEEIDEKIETSNKILKKCEQTLEDAKV